MAARVTVVNDNQDFLDLVEEILDGERYETTSVDGDLPDALDRIRTSRPDVLMLDLRMGGDGLHGWHIAEQVRADPELERLPILVCSADIVALREITGELTEQRDVGALEKPFTIDQLLEAVDSLLVGTAPR